MHGGIVGQEYSGNLNINECCNTGKITGNAFLGGIIGCVDTWHNDVVKIDKVYNLGNIKCNNGKAGGIVGNDGTKERLIIENSYNAGMFENTVNSSNFCISERGTKNNCYYLEGCNGISMQDDEIVLKKEFNTNNFINKIGIDYWKIGSKGYPVFRWQE